MRFEMNHEQAEDSVINITSMVDVVFILLAFFVLTATFGDERELAAGMEAPAEVASAGASDVPQKVVVKIWPAGNGVQIMVGQVSLTANAYDAITEKLTEVNLPASTVVLASDPNLPISIVSRAMDAILASPMRKISLARLEGQPAP